MTNYRGLSHTKWTCQYHVVFIPKYRKKVIYGELRRDLGEVLRRLAQQRESEVEEGHLMVDHVHIILSIPPKYSVAQVIGYIKGKSTIHIGGVHLPERHSKTRTVYRQTSSRTVSCIIGRPIGHTVNSFTCLSQLPCWPHSLSRYWARRRDTSPRSRRNSL